MRRYAIVAALLLFLMPSVASAKYHHTAVKHAAVTKSVARERAEAALPRVSVDANGVMVPDLRAAAAIVYDPQEQTVLYESHSEDPRPIASITKVMTATVYMDTDPDLSAVVTVTATDTKAASHTYLHAGDRVTVDDLMHLLLIASDNAAARVLARTSPYGPAGFIDRMNLKAADLGLMNTSYTDPAGLLKTNISTAYDMARLIVIVSSDDYVSHVMQLVQYSFRTVNHRLVAFHTTDHLLVHNVPVMAAKTGFTNPAGFCLASLLQEPSWKTVAIVVLGAHTNAERFIEVENLYQWWMLHTRLANLQVSDVLPAVHLSDKGIEFIKTVERFHAKPYMDSGGYAVGYGFHRWNNKRVTRFYPKSVTQQEADDQFVQQIAAFEEVLAASVAQPLSQPAYDALVSVAYNLGRINTHILSKLSAGRGVTPNDFLVTATVHRQPNLGLTLRRLREFMVFAGDYSGATLGAK
jgi:D-alanyl-D-alanine endopeptidase (penicillin-binding protein 7)